MEEVEVHEHGDEEQIGHDNRGQRPVAQHQCVGIYNDRYGCAQHRVARVGQQRLPALRAGHIYHKQEKKGRGPEEGTDFEVMGVLVEPVNEERK